MLNEKNTMEKQRTLVLVRHAKSSWSNPLQSDYERPLNDRGIHDAPMMGERLKEQNILPDLIISSTARRAAETAKKVAAAVGYDEQKIQWEEKLYHCIPPVFEEVLETVKDEVNTVFVVAHNPGISSFADSLDDSFTTGDMPTCAMVAARFAADSWSDFHFSDRKVFLYDYPKKNYYKHQNSQCQVIQVSPLQTIFRSYSVSSLG